MAINVIKMKELGTTKKEERERGKGKKGRIGWDGGERRRKKDQQESK
jgi:hypothetical protein